jgi:hypothetical protein
MERQFTNLRSFWKQTLHSGQSDHGDDRSIFGATTLTVFGQISLFNKKTKNHYLFAIFDWSVTCSYVTHVPQFSYFSFNLYHLFLSNKKKQTKTVDYCAFYRKAGVCGHIAATLYQLARYKMKKETDSKGASETDIPCTSKTNSWKWRAANSKRKIQIKKSSVGDLWL